MASPVFEAMFFGDMAEKNNPIPIVDVQPATFMTLLKYIYTGKLNITSIEIAYELFYTAKKYMLMENVERECIKYIWKQINTYNVCQVYEYALLFESNSLIQKCVQIICMYTRDVLMDKSFLDVQLNTAIAIFSMNYLDIDNELDLVEACILYANAQDKNKEEKASMAAKNKSKKKSNTPEPSTSKKDDEAKTTDSESDSETDDEENSDMVLFDLAELSIEPKHMQYVRELIEKIRFLTLTFDDLSKCTGILSDDEIYAIGSNIASNNCDVPMPSGFSTSRVRRHLMLDLGDNHNDETRPYANLRYKIQCLSQLTEDIWSPPFYVRNLAWQLKVIPRLSPSQNNHHKRGLMLRCISEDGSTTWSCDVRVVVATVHETGFPAGFKYYAHSFRSASNLLPMPLEWDVLLNPQNEYVTNDAITFEVRMITGMPYESECPRVAYMPYSPRGD